MTTTDTKTTLTLFVHVPGPGKTLAHYERTVEVPSSHAEEFVRAFWASDFSDVWDRLDEEVRAWILTRVARHGPDAWSSSAHRRDLTRFAPDLLD